MNIRPIKTEHDYQYALKRIEVLMDAEPNTDEGEELDILATLVSVYETNRFPLGDPDPVEAILFRMEQMGLKRKDLEPILGGRSRVSEVLNRKRGLSINQIRRLNSELRIPFDSLIG